MSPLPLVSILIPFYNAAPRIALCLQSIAQQTYPHLELHLINNNSTDNTLDLIAQHIPNFPHPIQLHHCPQQGANHARNYGFPHAQGEYIQWLDADDQLSPSKIAHQVHALETHPHHPIAYGDWQWHHSRPQNPASILTLTAHPTPDPLLSILLDNWHPPHSHLLRHSTASHLHQIQAWHPEPLLGMDREYFTTAALLGYRFLHVPHTPVHYHTWSASQITQSQSYPDRILSLSRIFQRLQQRASTHKIQLSPQQHNLLHQPWHLLRPVPASLSQPAADRYHLHHPHRPESLELSLPEARIVTALLADPYICTLEDHTRRIVRRLWESILQHKGYLDRPYQPSHFHHSSQLLNQLLELSPQQPDPLSHTLTDLSHEPDRPWLSSIPLYTPLFGAQRLAVYQVLDRLYQQGWLTADSP